MFDSIADLLATKADHDESLVARHLSRIEADETNAFIAVHDEAADQPHPNRGPLAGIPVALKDLIDHKGHITTAGSSFYRYQPQRSATVVDRLESAGAVIVGRTGLHEFAYGFSSENAWFGPVRNPWNHELSPGGSSGGSAAAVAAGLVPVAIGTDTGGSIRVPAALCGVYGLKVTHGRFPLTGVFPLAASLDTVGPLARTAADLAVAYEAIAGYDAADPWSRDPSETGGTDGLRGIRFGIPSAWLDAVPTNAETRQGFDTFSDELADAGAQCVVIDEPDLVPTPHVVTISAAEVAGVHRAWFTDIEKQYGPDVEERLAAAMEVTVDQLIEAKAWQARLVRVVEQAFRTCDVVLTPTVGASQKTIGVDTIDIDGSPQFYRPVLAGYTALVNQFGCPAIALPLAKPGIPPSSVQLIAPWWNERRLLDIASELERRGAIGTQTPVLIT